MTEMKRPELMDGNHHLYRPQAFVKAIFANYKQNREVRGQNALFNGLFLIIERGCQANSPIDGRGGREPDSCATRPKVAG